MWVLFQKKGEVEDSSIFFLIQGNLEVISEGSDRKIGNRVCLKAVQVREYMLGLYTRAPG